ncbi:hypothetical protein HYX06_00455 [Candidatus Woesearchaeota archaeon]|nr:hypothetical protein [Candidatus Woesearchaeota archaeon]
MPYPKMIELRNDRQRSEYIKNLLKEFFPGTAAFTDKFIDVGAMNYVYEAEAGGHVIYLKQALDDAKNKEKIGKDLAGIPKNRIGYEDKYIETISKFLPKEIELPKILKYDKENNILIISDVKKGGTLLEESLLNGNFNAKTAYNLGKFLGLSHKNTIGRNITIRGSEENDVDNWEIFLKMRTTGILQKEKFSDDVVKNVNDVYEDVKYNYINNVVINMDCCPKNVFERKNGSIGLVDFELASGIGDPAYDLGFLIGHYLIMLAIRTDKVEEAISSIQSILKGYREEMNFLNDKNDNERLVKYSGMIMIYRVAGSSPAPYIKADKMPLIKEIGIQLITRNFHNFDEVFYYIRKRLKN